MSDLIKTDTHDEAVHKKRKLLTPAFFIRLILSLLLVAALVAYLMGRFYVGFKEPDQRVTAVTQVCSVDPLLSQLNQGFTSNDYRDNIQNLEKAIQAKAHYQSDPTCVQALICLYADDYDIKNTKTYVDLLKDLAEKGLYPSNKLVVTSGIQANEDALNMLGD